MRRIALTRSIVEGPNYKWWVFGTVAFSILMTVIDMGSVTVALPNIGTHFGADLSSVQWVVLAYTLTISILILPMGRLGDIVGRKPLFIAGFAIFLVGALLSGTAQSLFMLNISRGVQGIGSAMIQANMLAMTISVFPDNERGKALGLIMGMVGTSAVMGPVLGGVIVSAFGWRYIFLLGFFIGSIALAISMVVLDKERLVSRVPSDGSPRPKFDWLGAGLSALALFLFLVTMTNAHETGWGSPVIVAGFLSFALSLILFVWWELRHPSPMLDLRLFKRKLVGFGVAAAWLSFFGNTSILLTLPFYLQRILGFSPRDAGLIMIPSAVAMALMAPISGLLSDRFGPRGFTVAGMACKTTALFILATTITADSSLTLIVPVTSLMFIGHGLFNSPNTSSIVSGVERSQHGVVTALVNLLRNSGNITGIALATTIIVATMASAGFEPSLEAVPSEGGGPVADAFVSGLRRAFLVIGFTQIVAMVLSFVRGERVEEPAPTSASQT
jgi:EmrB/QacA subfamily drug resistance transporter